MASSKPAVKFTYEDYRNTPADKRYELLEGELVMAPAPRIPHQRVAVELGTRLHTFVKDRCLGEILFAPCDVLLSNTDVVQPDLLFVSRERSDILLGGDNVRGAPDLVIEILSPSTSGLDRILKRRLYAKYGVREYWLVDPDAKTVAVLLIAEDGFDVAGTYGERQIVTSPTLKGFTFNLDEIF